MHVCTTSPARTTYENVSLNFAHFAHFHLKSISLNCIFSMQTIFKKDKLSIVFTIYINHSSQQIGLLHKSYSYMEKIPSWKRRQLVHPTPDNQSKLLTTAHEPTNYSQVGACLAAYSYAYPAPPLHVLAPPSRISTSTVLPCNWNWD
jgi:hypothetical protein